MNMITKSNRESIDMFVLQLVTIKYNTDPKDSESINMSITGTLDKVEAEYEINGINRNISFSLSNIEEIKIKFRSNNHEIIIYIK